MLPLPLRPTTLADSVAGAVAGAVAGGDADAVLALLLLVLRDEGARQHPMERETEITSDT